MYVRHISASVRTVTYSADNEGQKTFFLKSLRRGDPALPPLKAILLHVVGYLINFSADSAAIWSTIFLQI